MIPVSILPTEKTHILSTQRPLKMSEPQSDIKASADWAAVSMLKLLGANAIISGQVTVGKTVGNCAQLWSTL